MPGRVSCRLYLLLDALENFDISLDLRSQIFQLISKKIQPTGNTHCHNILYLSFCYANIHAVSPMIYTTDIFRTKMVYHGYF